MMIRFTYVACCLHIVVACALVTPLGGCSAAGRAPERVGARDPDPKSGVTSFPTSEPRPGSVPSSLEGCRTVRTVDREYGYTPLVVDVKEDDVGFDARGASWKFQNYPMKQAYPLRVRYGDRLKWHGGSIVGTVAYDVPRHEIYKGAKGGNGAGFFIGASGSDPDIATRDFLLDGMRIHNVWDGVRVGKLCDGFVIRNTWISDVRDDAIENDFMCGGTIEDCLIDGAYVFLSTRKKSATGEDTSVITIRRCVVALKPFAGPYRPERYKRDPGHAMFFKWYASGPRLVLEDNVFLAPQRGNCPDRNMGVPEGKLVSGKNNVMVWLGEGEYPTALPSSFAVVTTRATWDDARAAWIRAHPRMPALEPAPSR